MVLAAVVVVVYVGGAPMGGSVVAVVYAVVFVGVFVCWEFTVYWADIVVAGVLVAYWF